MIDQDDAVDVINSHFDELVNGKFSTAYLVVQTVRGILERFGVILPELHPTGFDEQIVYKANDDLYLCIMIDQDDKGHYDAYAQFVDNDGLDDVLNMDIETDEVEQRQLVSPYLRQVRRSADD
jgi:hypothetical protein